MLVPAVALSLLILVHCAAISVAARRYAADSPISVIIALNFIRVIPYSVLILLDPSLIDDRVLSFVGSAELEAALTEYFLLEATGSAIFFAVVYGADIQWPLVVPRLRVGFRSIAFLFALGASIIAFRTAQMGGMLYLLQNLEVRTKLGAGLGYLIIPAYVLLASSLTAMALTLGSNRSMHRRLAFFCLAICGMALLGVSGGRKNGLLLLLTCLIAWTAYVRPITANRKVLVGAAVLFYFYMAGVWLLRQSGGFESAIEDPVAFLNESMKLSLQVLGALSYLETYLSTIAYFERNDFWLGALFTAIPEAWMPSVIHPGKPPLDEGVYFKSFLEGYWVSPPMPASQLYPSSMPPETFGNGYAFLGVTGVIIFYIAKAGLFVASWRMAKYISQPFALVFLVYSLYGFEISVYRLTQVAQVFAWCFMLSLVFRRVGATLGRVPC